MGIIAPMPGLSSCNTYQGIPRSAKPPDYVAAEVNLRLAYPVVNFPIDYSSAQNQTYPHIPKPLTD